MSVDRAPAGVDAGTNADLPLAGIRVADFTAALAGPLSTMFLADLGAEVLKIEDAEKGEMARLVAPWIFVALNRNKGSLGIDLRTEDGRAIAKRIALASDVVVSSFRPGVMTSFGLGPDDLLDENPAIVYARLAGYGEDGPKAHRRGMDLTIRAESGLIASGNLSTPGIAMVDYAAGMMLAQAILAALFRRDRTGQGGVVDARLLDTGVFLQGVRLAEHSAVGSSDQKMTSPTADVFSASDGDMVIAVYYDRDFVRLCEGLSREDLAEDPRFTTGAGRAEHAEELRGEISAVLSTRSRKEWCDLFDELGVMVGSVLETDELFIDPQLIHNAVFHEVPHEGGAVRLVRLPYSFDGYPLPISSPSPTLNRDGRRVLSDLGLSDEEVDNLVHRGVITQ